MFFFCFDCGVQTQLFLFAVFRLNLIVLFVCGVQTELFFCGVQTELTGQQMEGNESKSASDLSKRDMLIASLEMVRSYPQHSTSTFKPIVLSVSLTWKSRSGQLAIVWQAAALTSQ